VNTDINLMLRRLGQFFETRSVKENFAIEYDLKAKHKISINESEIQQAIINLLNNAIDALQRSPKKHKKIFLSCNQDEGYTFISVTDNGEGIDPSIQHHMFDLLKTNRKEGMGLGLWLTRYIIERHGGTLNFESTNGLGTTFIIKLK
jgi:signal transduction histidine kinase